MISTNKNEHDIVSKFFKYNSLLNGDGIPANKKGSSVAYNNLQHNKILSELLGYIIPEEVNFIYKNYNYFCYEITQIEENNCLICGGKLTVSGGYTECVSCRCSCYRRPIDFYSYLPSGIIQDNTPKEIDHIFNHEFFDMNVKFKFREVIHKKCSRIHTQRLFTTPPVAEIKLKSLVYRVNICINGRVVHFDKIECPKNIKNSHLSVLGWKMLQYKY